MTVPSREEAARLLRSLDPPAWHLRHSRAVAEVAGWLALRAERRRPIDRRLVEAAALLHDIDKVLAAPRHDADQESSGREPRVPHGESGARWLTEHGHPELARAVELHPVTLLVEPVGAGRVLGASAAARIVAYADKRAGQRLEPMTDRFERWRRRVPHSRAGEGWSAAAAGHAWEAARALERSVCDLAGCRPEEVGRLRWTGPALAGARRTTAPGETVR